MRRCFSAGFCRNEKDASFSVIFCACGTLANSSVRRERERRESKSSKARARQLFPFPFFEVSTPPGLNLSFSLFSLFPKQKNPSLRKAATSRAPCSLTSSPEPWTLCARGPTDRSSAPTTSSSARLVFFSFFFFQFFARDVEKSGEEEPRRFLFALFFSVSLFFFPFLSPGGLLPSLFFSSSAPSRS